MIELATCNYSAYEPGMGAPVRTSIGFPRFFPHRPILEWENVYPERHWLDLPYEDYLPRYMDKLDKIGVDVLIGDIAALGDVYKQTTGQRPDRLVLLCYENLAKLDNWCHRTMLGDKLSYLLDIEVKELGPQPEASLF